MPKKKKCPKCGRIRESRYKLCESCYMTELRHRHKQKKGFWANLFKRNRPEN